MLPDKNNTEAFFQLALSFVSDIGPKRVRTLLSKFGTVEALFKAPLKELKTIDGIGEKLAKKLKDETHFHLAEKEMAYCEKHDIQLLFFNAANYPKRFLNCDDPPILLFYKGNADLNIEKTIAIIGTRKNTDYGQRTTEDLLGQLNGQDDMIIVSGLALGIDTIAHKAALKNNLSTVGVLGHSLDRIYPYSNKSLANEMLENGGLLSEFPSGTKPDRQNFPVRNRIVAGMSDVTIVVESDIKGGAMITAYVAASYNREVAAFPGRVYDSKSGGTNHLIKKNIAAMITNADDLLELMNWKKDANKKPIQQQLFLNLSPEEQKIIDLLQQKDVTHTDELLQFSGFTYPQLAAVLLQLELQGLIKTLPGKNYRLN